MPDFEPDLPEVLIDYLEKAVACIVKRFIMSYEPESLALHV